MCPVYCPSLSVSGRCVVSVPGYWPLTRNINKQEFKLTVAKLSSSTSHRWHTSPVNDFATILCLRDVTYHQMLLKILRSTYRLLDYKRKFATSGQTTQEYLSVRTREFARVLQNRDTSAFINVPQRTTSLKPNCEWKQCGCCEISRKQIGYLAARCHSGRGGKSITVAGGYRYTWALYLSRLTSTGIYMNFTAIYQL